ncbi:PAS domain-containing protein [Lacinutrix jangbogonensis]|uniref:PAS domain-containing protein n=1 Tax=Lacinutrix jangbogonensis TaxID=1469557 RepID=UPI000692224A|nr:PAS domain-containing protein [Lacinutrix jangbogonensis]
MLSRYGAANSYGKTLIPNYYCFILERFKMKLMKNTPLRAPLKSWDFYASFLDRQALEFSKNSDIEVLEDYKEKYNWSFNIKEELPKLNFDVIILTNIDQEIEWVNKGFKKMTGYPVNFTKGKTPRFLQGEKTSLETSSRIRDNIEKQFRFKEKVLNYRKNGDVYICEIEIVPLKNKEGILTHLLALEKEVYR